MCSALVKASGRKKPLGVWDGAGAGSASGSANPVRAFSISVRVATAIGVGGGSVPAKSRTTWNRIVSLLQDGCHLVNVVATSSRCASESGISLRSTMSTSSKSEVVDCVAFLSAAGLWGRKFAPSQPASIPFRRQSCLRTCIHGILDECARLGSAATRKRESAVPPTLVPRCAAVQVPAKGSWQLTRRPEFR